MNTDDKRLQEQRINVSLAEIKRAVHDGEWKVALKETSRLLEHLTEIVAIDAREQILTENDRRELRDIAKFLEDDKPGTAEWLDSVSKRR